MKKVFLYAYDRQNLGDDLFVHTIVRRYPHVQFYMWSDRKNREVFACLPNLKVVDKDSRWVHFLRRLRPSLGARYKGWLERRCDAVVYIGGSIFYEYETWDIVSGWWEYMAENRPMFVIGCNFGPWHTEAYREKMARIYGEMKDVCFRDRYSAELFKEVSIVRQAPDILFSWPMPKTMVKKNQVIVSVINCVGRDKSSNLDDHDERYVANMSALLRQLLDEGRELVLASFCAEEGDEEGIRKIIGAMGCENDPRVRTLFYDGTNADELTHAIAESGGVIATRFHGVILAIAAGRPVLPILYSDKMKHVLEDLGFEGPMYDLREEGTWSAAQMTTATAPAAQAEGHFEKLDAVLGR